MNEPNPGKIADAMLADAEALMQPRLLTAADWAERKRIATAEVLAARRIHVKSDMAQNRVEIPVQLPTIEDTRDGDMMGNFYPGDVPGFDSLGERGKVAAYGLGGALAALLVLALITWGLA